METKRANFELTPEQEAVLQQLKRLLDAPSIKETMLRSSRVVLFLANEMVSGKRLYLGEGPDSVTRLALPDIEPPVGGWNWLAPRPHQWRRQLWVKGRHWLAAQVGAAIQSSGMSEEEAAANWGLPREAIAEIQAYCAQNAVLIALEAEEETRQQADMALNLDVVY